MKVLIVEDDAAFLALIVERVRSWGHQVIEAANGLEAWQWIQNQAMDVVICDWLMPQMDGLALCRKIRQAGSGRYIYVIVISGRNAPEQVLTALSAGADDYLSKPLDFHQLQARLAIGERVLGLQEKLTGQIASLQRTYWQTIRLCAHMIEALDPELGGHSRRTAALSLEMARRLRTVGPIPEKALPILEAAALLHDVGLLLLPRTVWAKRRNERTGDEHYLFQQHPVAGARILKELDIMAPVVRLISLHHEQYNGRGFPRGLPGRRLPLLAQIVAAAAVYDNLIYRGGYSLDEAAQRLHRLRHVQLGPAMVDVLLEINHEGIQRQNQEGHEDLPLNELREGMVLAQDLTRTSGAVLIPKGTAITRYAIEKMNNYYRLRSIGDKVAVYRDAPAA
jgi:response regulator RpfG family c-di-GMP phosphodiesterase